jgi:DSF synthase
MNAVVEFPIFDAHANYETLQLEVAGELNALFSWMQPRGRPCFTSQLLHEIQTSEKLLETHQGHVFDKGSHKKLDYMIFGSKTPGVFNLGGDLEMFITSILRRDRATIEYYAKLCIENVYRRHVGFEAGITTIALVQGKALGGGFECALACDYIIAEKSASFGLPEVLFNLFPGMGAISFLTRKVGLKKAEQICLEGETFSARELHDLGVIDHVVEDGEGVAAVRSFIAARLKHGNAQRALARARSLVNPIARKELEAVGDVWVDAALALQTKDLRMMARLVRAQDKLGKQNGDEELVEKLFSSRFDLAVNA